MIAICPQVIGNRTTGMLMYELDTEQITFDEKPFNSIQDLHIDNIWEFVLDFPFLLKRVETATVS